MKYSTNKFQSVMCCILFAVTISFTQTGISEYDGYIKEIEQQVHADEFNRAIKICNKAITKFPSRPEAYVKRGEINYSKNRIKESLEDYTSAMQLDTNNVLYPISRAYVKRQNSDYTGAIADCDIALAHCPKGGFIYHARGWAKFYMNDSAGTYADWKEGEKLGDANASSDLKKYFSNYRLQKEDSIIIPVQVNNKSVEIDHIDSTKDFSGIWPVMCYKYFDIKKRLVCERTKGIGFNYETRNEYTYNTDGETREYFKWDTEKSTWITLKRYETIYRSSGKPSMEVSYVWDDTLKKLIGYTKYLSIYDNAANLLQDQSFKWSKSDDDWIGSTRTDYTYNTSGDRTEELHFTWNDKKHQLTPKWKICTTFINPHLKTSVDNISWDDLHEKWWTTERNVYTYNNGRLMSHTFLKAYWPKYDDLINVKKEENTYSKDGILSKTLEYHWNQTMGLWENFWMTEGDPENPDHKKSYSWNESIQQWKYVQ